MGYLYDEFDKRKQQAHIVDLAGFFDLVFEIHREMHKTCRIAMKLVYVSIQTESIVSDKVQSRDISE